MSKKHLSNPLSHREIFWGLLYLALELLVLPSVLYYLTFRFFPAASDAAVNFLFYSINFIAVWVIFSGFLRKNLALAGQKPLFVALYAALGLILYWCSRILIGMLTYQLMPDFSNVNDNTIAQISHDGFVLMAIGTVILVPTAEECLFRGAIFRGLYDKSRLLAYLISALAFGSIHVIGYLGSYDASLLLLCYVQYLPSGLILAWCYEKSDTICTPILIHTIINAIGIFAMR